jgi:hypothetical protein
LIFAGSFKLTLTTHFYSLVNMKNFLAPFAVCWISLSPAFALDENGNGMSDIFEQLYGVSNPNLDPDFDGKTNLQESLAGTNPLSNASYFKASYARGTTPAEWQLTWPSIAGKNYGFQISPDLSFWSTLPLSSAGTGGTLTRVSNYAFSGVTKTFYRVITLAPDDADGDGLDAWEELTLGTSDALLGDDEDLIPSVLEVINGTNPKSSTSPASNASYLALGNDADDFEIFTPGN